MPNNRIVTDALGTELEISLDENILTISDKSVSISAGKSECQIIKAFFDRALSLPRQPHDDEELSDDKKLSLISDKTPFVRLSGRDGDIDIHPPSWTPLSCEIALMLPRMKEKQ